MIKDENKLYWLLQAGGWLLFLFFFTGAALIWFPFGWKILLLYFNVTFFGFLISHFYHEYIKKNEWYTLKISNLALRILVASVLLAILWFLLVWPVIYLLFKERGEVTLTFASTLIVNFSGVFLFWNLLYFFYKFFKSFRESEIEKWKLNTAVKDAQLMALKSQINPHFIFNSLNNIRSLVIENPEKSRDMITYLSGLLRYSIQQNANETVALQDEITIVKSYLKLESIQLEDRLTYSFNIDKDALLLKIPPMSIQVLVENAIKHGISRLPRGGKIDILCKIRGKDLEVEVINTGHVDENKNEENGGIGLKNTIDRLQLLYGKMANFTLKNMERGMVSAKFIIPVNTKIRL